MISKLLEGSNMTSKTSKEKAVMRVNGFIGLLLGLALIGAGLWQGVIFVIEIFEHDIFFWNHAVFGGVAFLVSIIVFSGLRVIRPQEAIVYTFFGKYHGTLRKEGFHLVNPFATAFSSSVKENQNLSEAQKELSKWVDTGKTISLKTKTINNDKQKINDLIGNPIIVDAVVMWRITDTAKAVFDVDNYVEYLSSQCEAALRNVISMYPYDVAEAEGKALRTSIVEVAEKLKLEIQEKVGIAGIEIVEARITNMYYAPEIASAMLQRQQAKAVLDAKHTIVEGAVDIVDMALTRLSENGIVDLDEERKAAMVSNLLVVLCGNKDAQPVVNSGTLY